MFGHPYYHKSQPLPPKIFLKKIELKFYYGLIKLKKIPNIFILWWSGPPVFYTKVRDSNPHSPESEAYFTTKVPLVGIVKICGRERTMNTQTTTQKGLATTSQGYVKMCSCNLLTL
jgi:hypothetical protein